MKRLISSLIIISMFGTGCARHSAERQTVFLSCQTDSIPYRIPAMTELKDGSIMILADYRHCMSDIGFGRVDIRGRKLDSKGRRWSDEFILIEGTGIKGATDCGYGDPAVVTDRENNEILVSLVCGNTVYWHSTTTRENS